MTAPFCASNSVGIFSVLFAEVPVGGEGGDCPLGRLSSKLVTGTSGTVLNVEVVIPACRDECRAVEVDGDALALEDDDQGGERFTAVGDEVHGPVRGRRDRGDRVCVSDDRGGGAARGVRCEHRGGAGFLQGCEAGGGGDFRP